MKTALSKLKLTFLLALIAAVICCASIAFAGIFGAKNSVASADETADALETTEPADDTAASDNDADGLGTGDNVNDYTRMIAGRSYTYDIEILLNGTTCAEQAAKWQEAVDKSRGTNRVVLVTLTRDWIAAPVTGKIWEHGGQTNQETSFSGVLDTEAGTANKAFYYGQISLQGAKIILDLNGHKIDRNKQYYSSTGGVFWVNGNQCYDHKAKTWYTSEGILYVTDSAGGGIITGGKKYYGNGGAFALDGLHSSSLYIDGGTISGNYSEYGGAIGVGDTKGWDIEDSDTPIRNVYIRGGTITNNTADDDGGAICFKSRGGSLTVSGGAITNNVSWNESHKDHSEEDLFSGGGGIYFNGAKLTMSGGLISGNSSYVSECHHGERDSLYDEGWYYFAAYGGGVAVEGGAFEMSGGEISGNKLNDYGHGSTYGGGVAINDTDYYSTCRMTMTGGVISGNSAQLGGGLYFKWAPFTMSGGLIANNTATYAGGGVYHYNNYGDSFTLSGGVISGNYAERNGGGVYAGSDINFTGGSFVNNEAGENGGAIYYNAYRHAIIRDISFTGNTAYEYGGAIYLNNYSGTTSSYVQIEGCNFTENEVEYYGGAIYVKSSCATVYFEDNSFAGNNAEYGGVSIYLEGNSATASNNPQASFMGNTYTGYSYDYYQVECKFFSRINLNEETVVDCQQGLMFQYCPNVSLSDCVIKNMDADLGVYYIAANSTYSLSMDNCILTQNRLGGVKVSGNTDKVYLSGGTYIAYGESDAVSTSGELHISGAINLLRYKDQEAYNASILNVGDLSEYYDGDYYGGANIDVSATGIITKGYSENNSESPSVHFRAHSDEVWLLNGEVYVGNQPTLTWAYSINNGSSYTNVASSATGYSGAYTGSAWTLRARYGTETTNKTVKYYNEAGTEIAQSAVKNVGTYTVKVIDANSEWGNAEFKLTITKKQITEISGVTASNKAFDGTTTATVNVSNASFKEKVAGDTLTLLYTGATFADANVGENKTVTLNGIVLGGAAAGNYEIASTVTVTATANITKLKTTVKWTNTSVDYTGEAQTVTASYKTVDGTETTLTVGGTASATNAGTYTASVTAPANYEFTNADCDWKINKATPTVNAKLTGATGLQVGDDMPEITITEGDTAGTIVWVNNSLKQGKNKYGWVFVPTDSANYLIATGEEELEVSAAAGVTFKGIKANYEQTKSIPSNTALDKLGDFGTLTVKETYSDGTEVAVTDYKLSIKGEKLTVGSNKVTVTYTFGEGEDAEDYTAEITIFVVDDKPEEKDPELKSITASFTQETEIDIAEEFDISKLGDFGTLTVKEVYDDNSTKVITTGYKLELPEGGLKVGFNVITVIYTVVSEGEEGEEPVEPVEYKATFNVFVVDTTIPEPNLTDISVSFAQTANIPEEVNVNQQLKNYGVLVVKELYDDGSEKIVTETADYTLTGPEGGIKAGANVITLTYTVGTGESAVTYTKTFSIFVNKKFVTGIKATYTADGDIYVDSADAAGSLNELFKDTLKVVTISNDGSEPVELAYNYYTLEISGGKFVIGNNTVVVTYTSGSETFKDVFEVTVVAHDSKIQSIEATATQKDVIYSSTKLEDLASKLDITVTATNADGDKSTLSASDYEITAFDAATGEVTVTLKSDTEITAKFNVFVTPKAITKITVDYKQGLSVIYPDFQIADLKDRITVKVHYNDGSEAEKLADDVYDLAGNLAVGTSTIAVTYEKDGETYSTSFTVEVTAKAEGSKTPVAVNWKNTSFVFDGKEHAPVAYYFIDGGKYEVILKITLSGDNLSDGKAVNVGTYKAVVDETSVKDGYELTGDKFVNFVITEAKVEITWTNTISGTYNGNAQTPTFKAESTVDDKTVKFDVEIVPKAGSSVSADGEAVNAGEYIARLKVTDGGNYTVVGDTEYSFTIAKDKISKQSNVDSSKKFSSLNAAVEYVKGQYAGKKVIVSGIENADGGYDITVSIADETNYEWAGKEGDVAPVKFSFAQIVPGPVVNYSVGMPAVIALSAVLAVAGLIAIIAFIMVIVKSKSRYADDDGFYEAYVE